MNPILAAVCVLAFTACSKKAEDQPPAPTPTPTPTSPIDAAAAAPPPTIDAAPSTPSDTLTDVDALDFGFETACAKTREGRAACWGSNVDGALGFGASSIKSSPRALPVKGIDDAVQLAVGFHFACVARVSGTVSCWGQGSYGQLGVGSPPDSCESSPLGGSRVVTHGCALAPVEVPALTGVLGIAAGSEHACAVTVKGEVFCWGVAEPVGGKPRDTCTVSANQVEDCAMKPQRVEGLGDAVEVAAATRTSCARTRSGTVRCWGSGRSGELGDGNSAGSRASAKPVAVRGLTDAVQLTAFGFGFCARRGNGQVSCWGADERGKLGDGSEGTPFVRGKIMGRPRPQVVRTATAALDGITDLWGASEVTCGARSDGTWCWGHVRRGVELPGVLADPCPSSTSEGYCTKTPAVRVSDAGVRFIISGLNACVMSSAGLVHCAPGPTRGAGAQGLVLREVE
jgi:alpha-tubulin suppressor-like RCC1 family protein